MNDKIKVFAKEIELGLSDQIKAQSSVAYCSVANKSDKLITDLSESVQKSIASANQDQKDLYYLNTVLVSTGWNKNDDVFLPDLTWAARNTPKDKQFNLMHDENNIIGHMTGSYVVDTEGNKLSDDLETAPASFDIITEAVIYKAWQKAENKERMDKILAEIDQDEWFVSMECLFSNFHYAVLSPDGQQHLIERSESSSHLSQHLRAYGGEGEYEGYKIGRALDNIAFSGKGLVSKPANPRSVILRSEASFNVKANEFTKDFTIGENQMDELKAQVDELKKELATTKAEAEKAKKEAEDKKDKEQAALVEAKDTAIAELNEKIEAALKEVAKLQAAAQEKDTELAQAKEAVDKMEKEKKYAKRKADLVEAGFSDEDAEASVQLYEPLSDEAFAQVVAKFPMKGKDNKEEKDEKKDDSKAEKDEKKDDKSEATADTFDEVEDTAEATVNTEDTDESDELRQSVAGWIGSIYELDDNEGDK